MVSRPYNPTKSHKKCIPNLVFSFGFQSSSRYSKESQLPERPDQNCASMLNVKFTGNVGGDVIHDVCNI